MRDAIRGRVVAGMLLCAAALYSQGREHGRSMVISKQGIAATSQTLASQAAAQILAKGGSAVDAAIAANAVLSLMEPMMCGPGGDLFVLYREAKTGKLVGLNASGPAPRALSAEYMRGRGLKEIPVDGIDSVSVPGAVDGWAKIHQRYGRLPWKTLFQAAIQYAEQGFPVPEMISQAWGNDAAVATLKGQTQSPESVRLFLPGGKAPATGDLFRNPKLAAALRLIAEKGPEAFYRGEIAAAILATSQRLGGKMTREDLSSFSSEWVEPISTEYRGWRVYELPPNGQGLATLEMLNIMQFRPAAPGGANSALEFHQRIEAMKLAYADLRYDADTHFAKVPTDKLISKEYARGRAALINPAKANCSVEVGHPVGGDTTYLTVVDREGNMASWIQSIASSFGSGVTVDGMGFLLHNRGSKFGLDPGDPNVLAGGKRPFHTIIPALMDKGDVQIAFGIMGGPNQPMAQAQFVSDIVDFGMDVQKAMDAPRFTKRDNGGCEIWIESRLPLPAFQELSEWGHQIRIARPFDPSKMGRGQAILRDGKTGTHYGASDPRADGSAIPEPIN